MFGRTSGVESILHALSRLVSSIVGRTVLFTRPVLQSVSSLSGWGVSLTRTVLESVLSFVGMRVSLTSPVLVSVSFSVGRGGVSYSPLDRICVFVRRIGRLS